MSEAFSQSPPVYASSNAHPRQTTYPSTSTSYPSTSTSYPTSSMSYSSSSTPYPTNPTPYSSIPTPYSTNLPPYPSSSTPYPTNPSMPMPTGVNTSYSYPQGYPQPTIPADVFRESLQAAALNKIRYRFDETIQVGNAEIESLKKAEQDLTNGEKKLQSIINELQQQQIRAQNYITNLNAKKSEISEAAQKISSKEKENSVKDDALIIPAPIYKQLLQAYAEEHAIQDLLYYLADGLRKQSIGLDTYLKHVRELSRKQFMLRATMHRCRQIAGLPIK
jgi:ESCRT-I complex subunit TSG101